LVVSFFLFIFALNQTKETMSKSKFLSTENKGFQLTFENGWTISVQFGTANYCSNRNIRIQNKAMVESLSAEIAIWDADNKNFDFGGGRLDMGWLTTDEVAEWIEKVKNFK
jgi:hypothetical protein